MNTISLKKTSITISLMMWLAFSIAAGANSPTDIDIEYFVVGSGGGSSSGGLIVLTGIIGQPNTGTMTSTQYELSGGFWPQLSRLPVSGDCNADGVIDLSDYRCFVNCMQSPGQTLLPACNTFDFDNDGDVDLVDYNDFHALFGI